MSSKYETPKNKKEFISLIYKINRDSEIKRAEDRYREMGLECHLANYLFYRETSYSHDVGNKPMSLPDNSFIALNVEVPVASDDNKLIVPVFSISAGGARDTKDLRTQVLDISKGVSADNDGGASSDSDRFLTCLEFMNLDQFELDRVLFKITIEKGALSFDIARDKENKVLAFSIDEDNETRIAQNCGQELLDYLNKDENRKNFLVNWCQPFISRNQTLYCNIRAVDRDERCKAHSIFVVILNYQEEVKDWVSAFSDDVMNIMAVVKSIFIEDIHKKQLTESIKSAVSAIMSRNMSHNLGSHYLFYTKTHLMHLSEKSSELSPDIRGVAKVLGYMQARMDYLATLISNDKYPFGAVNFKSQLYDELTVDDFSRRHFVKQEDLYKRTTNFLLSNLILSENFTRPNVINPAEPLNEGLQQLIVRVAYSEGKNFRLFTGSDKLGFKEGSQVGENAVKNALSNLSLALPGGTMSSHAFFNIFENFIRNSAKYLQKDFDPEGLVCTIALKPSSESPELEDIIFYDNKHNAFLHKNGEESNLLRNLQNQVEGITILDPHSGQVEKRSKGFKEMLFSAAWMKAYTYGENSFADVITEINEAEGEEKVELINKYGFRIVAVVEKSASHKDYPKEHSVEQEISVYTRLEDVPNEELSKASIGLMFSLLKFQDYVSFKRSETGDVNKDLEIDRQNTLKVYADVVKVDKKHFLDVTEAEYPFRNCFTRIVEESDITDPALLLKAAIGSRFPDIEKYKLVFDDGQEEPGSKETDKKYLIRFERHMNTKEAPFEIKYNGYAYADTVSGGNFTITVQDLCTNNWPKAFCLKVKESALTRITLIDERLFNNMKDSKTEVELSFKNLRILNYNQDFCKAIDGQSEWGAIFEGNCFRDKSDCTHFLSIHLGLVEKILKNSKLVNAEIDRRLSVQSDNNTNFLDSNRVKCFMTMIKQKFSTPFIAIHSGRGNFSQELEGPLQSYPFISLSAIESLLSNSKYLLSQLFYNTIYIGKGVLNKHDDE